MGTTACGHPTSPLAVLNQTERCELGTLFLEVQHDPAIRCVVFESSERCFCAGAGLGEYALRLNAAVARAHVNNSHRTTLALDAGTACDMGLVEEVVDDDALDFRVQALANCIANQPPPQPMDRLSWSATTIPPNLLQWPLISRVGRLTY